jgi:dolichyl-phosphate-mannose--protein O-mannosyl transferase
MLQEITYFMILGRPLLVWMGMLTLLAILLTAAIAVLNRRGVRTIPFVWHPRCAVIAVVLALAHGTLAMLAYW